MRSIQVTLGSAATPIVSGETVGGVPSQARIAFQLLIIQNNAAHVCRVGDATVSATKGIALASGSVTPTPPLLIAPSLEYSSDLSEYYLFGTAGDVIDVLYME